MVRRKREERREVDTEEDVNDVRTSAGNEGGALSGDECHAQD